MTNPNKTEHAGQSLQPSSHTQRERPCVGCVGCGGVQGCVWCEAAAAGSIEARDQMKAFFERQSKHPSPKNFEAAYSDRSIQTIRSNRRA